MVCLLVNVLLSAIMNDTHLSKSSFASGRLCLGRHDHSTRCGTADDQHNLCYKSRFVVHTH